MAVMDRFPRPVQEHYRARGEKLVADGDVEIDEVEKGQVRGEVMDSAERFHTTLSWFTGSMLGFSCECEMFRRGEICPHVVATALAVERQGLIEGNGEARASEAWPHRQETLPRSRGRAPVWLSPTGQLRRVDQEEPRPTVHHQPSQPSWRKVLEKLKQAEDAPAEGQAPAWPAERQILYIIDVPASLEGRNLVVRLACRDRKASGQWSRAKTRGVSFPAISALRDPVDQQILSLLKAGTQQEFFVAYDPVFRVSRTLQRLVTPMICRTGRALLCAEADADEMAPLTWDEEGAWELYIEARREESTQMYIFSGVLRRGEERIPITRPVLATGGGVVFFADKAAVLEDGGAGQWIPLLRQQRALKVPVAQANEMLGEVFAMAHLPRLDLPEELRVEMVQVKPRPRLAIRAPEREEFRPERLRAVVSFDYDGVIVLSEHGTGHTVFQGDRRRRVIRDEAAEAEAWRRLQTLGMREALNHSRGGPELWFNRRHMLRIVRILVEDGWQVETDGRLYRRPGAMRLNLASGIDWFELRGEADFGGQTATLPDLLTAIRRGETSVQLSDGTLGMIPPEWMSKYGLLSGMGEVEADYLKFAKAQVGLLDALLASQPEATCDEVFERMRGEMKRFEGVGEQEAPKTFIGELRPYQRDGLGWFSFLQRFGFGGCLADDMGLGKTVQVLALLEGRRLLRLEGQSQIGPSLVVVPKSIVFNWEQEAHRFTPQLKILDHTGIDRIRGTDHLGDYDAIITTYGTIRRDAAFLKDVEFDYVILDEAQAIKNPASESAKAIRLVRGKHRLALSGTPVQNHLGDLWSLFEFLNPGMLGSANVFAGNLSALRNPEEQTRLLLARALRPFILRRTKEQVARDLPEKLEQTIYCELEAEQRRLYDELKEYYRRSLLEKIDRDGLGRSKMQILEALLRLRQAALHPGLIDPARTGESSAKLEMLLPQLEEVLEEGHKALVFSQFTSMLAIVRAKLDERKISYEYLDGKTRDREARVRHFQEDKSCKLFLISLKAGGLGLNLTAADYVFLLDPWWNPAIEQQAIDRAHRIGQDKRVYACRLIAKDTVEEKVLELQQGKRDLAEAIITADNSLIRTLGREELELLLS